MMDSELYMERKKQQGGMSLLNQLKADLQALADPEKALILSRFFKTDKGQYGEGDIFLGITVPKQRAVAKGYYPLSLEDIQKLLNSPVHEHRFVSLLILIQKYKIADPRAKKDCFDFYIDERRHINSWDLVDLSAPKIVGDYLLDHDRKILYHLVTSENVWDRRIAILSTFAFINNSDFSDAFRICRALLKDPHDLIHKASGWMLREIGKKDEKAEENFLRKYYSIMPRTMLRYAIERFGADSRRFFMSGGK